MAANPALGSELLTGARAYREGACLPFEEWIRRNPEEALRLGRDLETRLLVVADPATSPRCRYRVVYDGRNQAEGEIYPERAVLLEADGSFRVHSTSRLLRRKLQPLCARDRRKTMLWQLLKLDQPFPDPRNREEVVSALKRVPPDQLPDLDVRFVSFRRNNKMWSNSRVCFANPATAKRLLVEALPSSNYGLKFRLKKSRAPNKAECNGGKEEEEAPLPPEPSLLQSCRSSCVKIERSGLNLAYDLGLLNREERKKISQQLARTAAAFVVQYGKPTAPRSNTRTPKWLTYADITCTHTEEIDFAQPASSQRATCFARWLWQVKRPALVNARRAILQDLLSKLKQFPMHSGSLYKKCKLELERRVQEQHYVMFCKDDTDLHHLRGFVAEMFYSCEENQKKKIQLRLTSRNDLVALTCPDFRVVNLKQYLDLDEDPVWKPALTRAPRNDEDWAQAGEKLAGLVVNSWLCLGGYLLKEFDHELHSTSYAGTAFLSSKAAESKFLADSSPLQQGREKLKPYYAKLLRQSLRGGFHFSARLLLYSGAELAFGPEHVSEPIFCPGPGGERERVASLHEYDVNSSYGFSASSALLPGGFCVGFVAENFAMDQRGFSSPASGGALLKRPDNFRSETYEFRAVYCTLQKILEASGPSIRSVYSNFHPRGLFSIDKCYADLAVIFEDGKLELFNFDPAFTHGCNVCPELKSYVGRQSHYQVMHRTEERDKTIRQWTSGCPAGNVSYQTVSDCCHLSKATLDAEFLGRPELQHLQQSCPHQRALSGEDFLEWLKQHRNDRNFTYIAWIEGAVPEDKRQGSTPLLLHPRVNNPRGQELGRATGDSAALVTRDYLEYLQDKFDFRVSAVSAALFFGVDRRTNEVYGEVSALRCSTSGPVEKNFLKKVLNLSLGFTALNSEKGPRPKYYFGTLPAQFGDTSKYHVLSDLGVTERGEYDPLFVVQHRRGAGSWRRPSKLGYLPFYATVIERGRMRLAEFIVFLQSYLPPHTFRLLFCNTDNLQFVCSAADWESLVSPERAEEFQREKSGLISSEKVPGLFKPEWHVLPPFKYVTAAQQNWCVWSDHFLAHKWSGLSRLTAGQPFDLSCKMLRDEPFCVEQLRRLDKVRSLACDTKTFTFNEKRKHLPPDVSVVDGCRL